MPEVLATDVETGDQLVVTTITGWEPIPVPVGDGPPVSVPITTDMVEVVVAAVPSAQVLTTDTGDVSFDPFPGSTLIYFRDRMVVVPFGGSVTAAG